MRHAESGEVTVRAPSRAGTASAAAAAIGEPLHRAGRAEIAGDIQRGIEVAGADHSTPTAFGEPHLGDV